MRCSMPPKAVSACGGGAHASVESIAAQAGWSRGAASYHFRGKAELLRAVLAPGAPARCRTCGVSHWRRDRSSPRCWPAHSAGWRRCRGDPHARNVFGILAWAYDYADDYAGIRRETLALGLREFRLLRALLRRAGRRANCAWAWTATSAPGCWPPGGWSGRQLRGDALPQRRGRQAAVRAFAAGAACADRTAGPGRRRGASGQWRGRGPAQAGRETYLLWRRQGGARHGVALTCCSSPQATC